MAKSSPIRDYNRTNTTTIRVDRADAKKIVHFARRSGTFGKRVVKAMIASWSDLSSEDQVRFLTSQTQA